MIKKDHRFINGTMFLIQYCVQENQEQTSHYYYHEYKKTSCKHFFATFLQNYNFLRYFSSQCKDYNNHKFHYCQQICDQNQVHHAHIIMKTRKHNFPEVLNNSAFFNPFSNEYISNKIFSVFPIDSKIPSFLPCSSANLYRIFANLFEA